MDKFEAQINGEGGHEHPHADHRTFEQCAQAVYAYSHHALAPGALLTIINKETGGVRYWISTTKGLEPLTGKQAAEHMTHQGWVLPGAGSGVDIEREAERLAELFGRAHPDDDGIGVSWPYLTETEKGQWRAVVKATRGQPT